jgi:ribose 5-phosphate isomerase B
MRIAVGADHGGYRLKRIAIDELRRLEHDVLDLGTDSEEPVDYPDFAQAVAEMVMESTADRGLLICGSGVGASVAANKIPGVRAAVCHDTYSARQGVEHDDMNVLCLGARVVGVELALELIRAWVGAHFSGTQRYARRLAKLQSIETQYQRSAARD